MQSLNREALLRVRGDMLAGETKVGGGWVGVGMGMVCVCRAV